MISFYYDHSKGAAMAVVLCILAATQKELALLMLMNDDRMDDDDDDDDDRDNGNDDYNNSKFIRIKEIVESKEFSNPAKLFVFLSGFIPRDDSILMMTKRLQKNVVGIALNSLHIFSDEDDALESQLSIDVMGLFENPIMCVREGGHDPQHDIEMYTARIRNELLQLKASASM